MRIAWIWFLALSFQVGEPSRLPRLSGEAFDGDPVNLSTGLYWRSDEDLEIAGTSVALTRTYRTRDEVRRPFGFGVSHSYNLYLIGDSKTFQWADLILADGGRIHYRRVSGGQTKGDVVFEHTESPTEFYGSLLQWNGGGWNIDFRDGSRYAFGACTPGGRDICHVLVERDKDGNEARLDYDPMADDLTRISVDERRWIALTYDASHHIVASRASTGGSVRYEYDAAGDLVRVSKSDGRVQDYTYGPHHEVLTIREPDREIVNTYDAALRCVKQVIARGRRGEPAQGAPEVFQFSYRTNAQNRILETRIVQPTGALRVATFNVNGYLVTDTTDPDGPAFTQVVYARDAKTNLSPRVTVRCSVGGQIVEAFATVSEFEHPDEVRGALLARTCR
jgi:YD repeat-containing protein